MAKLRAFSVPPEHADAALTDTHNAGDAALFLDPSLTPVLRNALCASFAPSSLTLIDAGGIRQTTKFADGVTLDDSAALVVLTSGSTGTPKGVQLSHDALTAAVAASLSRLTLTRANTVIQALPPHHVAGLLGVLRARALGANLVTVTSTQAMARVRGELVALVPTQLARLVTLPTDLSQFGTILLGGAAAPPDLLTAAHNVGATLVSTYGMSETCGGCVYDGLPLKGTTVVVDGPDDDTGRILIQSPQLFDGYRIGRNLIRHDATHWFATSDQGLWQDGLLHVAGRMDETVVSGGENIPLSAVRAALRATTGITDLLVFSRPSHTWGDEVLAVLVTDLSLQAVKTQLLTVLPPHWIPRHFTTVTAIPTTPLGKPDVGAAQALFD